MSYTTVYRFQDLNGYESVISKANSDMTYEAESFSTPARRWSTRSPVRSRPSCCSRAT